MISQQLTRISLWLFVASIAISAIFGIYAIAVPTGNWDFKLRIFFTTATVAGASVCGLSCGSCLSRGHRVLPTAGLFLTCVSTALILLGLWAIPERRLSHPRFLQHYWETTWVLAVFAIACGHLSLLLKSNLAERYCWAYPLAYFLVFSLAALILVGVVVDKLPENDMYWRAIGILSILVAAITLLIPVFHRFSRDEVAAKLAEADPLLAIDEEIARVKKQLIELENRRRVLLGRSENDPAQV